MASFKSLEMAAVLSQDNRIEIKKSLFGQKALYQPTQSPIDVEVLEYAPDAGARMERLLTLSTDKLMAELQTKEAPKSTPVGQFRLEVCRSKDGAFAAVQLFRFADFTYHVASELKLLEGADVALVEKLLGNK